MEDLALDCIADLFNRNEGGALIQLQAYFNSFNLDEADEAETLSHLRRLVCARVNQSIFRIYNDLDPVLGKILRNIKIALDALHNYEVMTRFGQISLVPVLTDSLLHAPEADIHAIVLGLRDAGIRQTDTVPTMLSKLSIWLREQSEYCRIIPIMTIAQSFRTIYDGDRITDGITREDASKFPLSEERILSLLEEACGSIKKKMVRAYLGKGKLDQRLFDVYFQSIQSRLIKTVVHSDGQGLTYFDEINKQAPELSYEEYRSNHRKKVEYLGRLVEAEFKARLTKEVDGEF